MQRTITLLQKEWKEWNIVDKLGEGSYGTVYSAKRDAYGFTDWSAIKHISIPASDAELNSIYEELGSRDTQAVRAYLDDTKNNLINEYRQMMELQGHTNIVACHDVLALEKEDALGYDLFIRMELLESVSKRILNGQMNRAETIKLGADICKALMLLEDKKIVHRDIKPQNIFVNDHGDYKLGDFGAARSLLGSVTLMSIKGTAAYMSPEIIKGEKAGFTADIYSLGLVMYRLMNSNKTPFQLMNQASTSSVSEIAHNRRLTGEELPPPAEADQELAMIILKACAFDPKDRWQSAEEMYEALTELQNGTFKKVLTNKEKAQILKETAVKELVSKRQKEQLQAEQNQARENKKKKKTRNMVIAAAAAVVLGIGAFVTVRTIGLNQDYQAAKAAFEAGKLEEALSIYQELGSYKDAAQRVLDTQDEMALSKRYQEAEEKYTQKDYRAALEIFQELKDYKDAKARAEGIRSLEKAYESAEALFVQGKYQEARDAFDNLGDYADADAQRDEMQKYVNFNLAEDYFKKGQLENALNLYKMLEADGFKGAAQRRAATEKAIENAAQYKKAQEHEARKEYDQAKEIYASLGFYEDAPEKAEEMQKHLKYAEAQSLYKAGKYEEALAIFEELGNFADAFNRVTITQKAIENKNKNDAYRKAQELEAEGKYQEALEAYKALGSYLQASNKASEMQKYVNYEKADALYGAEEYEAARDIFENLGAFEDARERLAETKQQIEWQEKYQQAQNRESNGQYDKARALYQELGDYKDAKARVDLMQKYIDYTQAEKFFNNGAYESAAQLFAALGDFEDAREKMAQANAAIEKQNSNEKYSRAQNYEKQGNYEEAKKVYETLGSFNNADLKAAEMEKYIQYEKAQGLMDAGEYENALAIYKQLGKFENAQALKKTAETEIKNKNEYARALTLEQNEKYQEAQKIYLTLGEYKEAAQKAEEMQRHLDYAKGCALYEEGAYEEALDIFEALGAFKDAPDYHQKAKDQVALMKDYQLAEEMEAAGQYRQAKDKYESLGEYRDARERAAEVQKRIDYEMAKEHMDAGEYEQAVALFKSLGDFYDSKIRLSRAEKKLKEVQDAEAYRQAQALEAAEKYQEALDAYAKLGAYQNAGEKALEMKKYVDYQQAAKLMAAGSYEEAIEIFKALGSFKDAQRQIQDANTEISKCNEYKKASELEAQGQYEQALKIYAALGSYKEAKNKAAEMQKHLNYLSAGEMMKKGEYEKAIKAYQALGEFKDAAEQIKKAQQELSLQAAYQQAQAYAEKEEYQKALSAYEALGSYKDAAAQAAKLKEYMEWLRTAVRQADGTYVSLVNGDNLLAGSLEERKAAGGLIEVSVQETLKKYVGMPVTISFEAMATGDAPCDVTVDAYRKCGISIASSYTFRAVKDGYRRFSFTTDTANFGSKTDSETGKSYNQGSLAFTAANEGKFSVRKIKIEIGKTATDWTFAPHDPLVTTANLIKDSAKDRTSHNGFLQLPVREALEKYVGMPVVISFEAKSNGTKAHDIQVYTYQSSGIGVDGTKTVKLAPDKFQRYEFHTTVRDYQYRVNAASGALYSDGSLAFYDPADTKQNFTIRRLKIEVGTKATAWTLAPDDPKITGENLLAGGGTLRKSQKNGYIGINVAEALKAYVGTNLPITVSFEAKMLTGGEKEIMVYPYQNSGISIGSTTKFKVSAQEFKRYSFTTTVRDYGIKQDEKTGAENTSVGVLGFYDQAEYKDSFAIRQVKIEIGNEATAWTPARKDTYVIGENLLAGYAQEMTARSGFAEISVHKAFKGLEGLPVTVSFEAKVIGDKNQKIQIAGYQYSGLTVASSVVFNVPNNEYQRFTWNTAIHDYGYKNDPKTGALYSLGSIGLQNISAEKLPFSIRKVKIEIGREATDFTFAPDDAIITGGNMLIGFAKERRGTFVEVPVAQLLKNFDSLPVTISFEAKSLGSQDCKINVYPYQNSGISIAGSKVFTASPLQFQQFSFTTTVRNFGQKSDPKTGKAYTAGGIGFHDTGEQKQGFVIRKIKLELGNQATAWSFAPGDPLYSGQNLLLGHTTEQISTNGFLSIPVRDTLESYVGLPVTISFEAKANGNEAHEVMLYTYQNSGIGIAEQFKFTPDVGEYRQFNFTATVKDYGYQYNRATGQKYADGVLAFYDYADSKSSYTIRKVKIEIGDTCSGFSFAPNDPLISGENLLPGYAMEQKSTGFLEILVRSALERYAGLPVTVSFDARSEGEKAHEIAVYAYQDSGVSIEGRHKFKLSNQGYQRYTFTTTVRDYGYKHNAVTGAKYSEGSLAFYDPAEEKQPFSIRHVKIEIGGKGSGKWSLAPNDPLITGENLLPGSAAERRSSNGYIGIAVRNCLKDYVDMPITISFEAMMLGTEAKNITIYPYQSSGITIGKGAEINVPAGQYRRFTLVTTVADYGYKNNAATGEIYSGGELSFYDPAEKKDSFVIRNVKIEVGTKATPWTPSPADEAAE